MLINFSRATYEKEYTFDFYMRTNVSKGKLLSIETVFTRELNISLLNQIKFFDSVFGEINILDSFISSDNCITCIINELIVDTDYSRDKEKEIADINQFKRELYKVERMGVSEFIKWRNKRIYC